MTVTEPLDETHRESLWARDQIERRITLLKYHASLWHPRPCPTKEEYA